MEKLNSYESDNKKSPNFLPDLSSAEGPQIFLSSTRNTSDIFKGYQLWKYANEFSQVGSKMYLLLIWKEEEATHVYFSRNAQHLRLCAQISSYKIFRGWHFVLFCAFSSHCCLYICSTRFPNTCQPLSNSLFSCHKDTIHSTDSLNIYICWQYYIYILLRRTKHFFNILNCNFFLSRNSELYLYY